jgi:hypothetical protein
VLCLPTSSPLQLPLVLTACGRLVLDWFIQSSTLFDLISSSTSYLMIAKTEQDSARTIEKSLQLQKPIPACLSGKPSKIVFKLVAILPCVDHFCPDPVQPNTAMRVRQGQNPNGQASLHSQWKRAGLPGGSDPFAVCSPDSDRTYTMTQALQILTYF